MTGTRADRKKEVKKEVKKELEKRIGIVTPFEVPDVRLALAAQAAGALAVLHLGRDRDSAEAAMRELADRSSAGFGVCLADTSLADIALPKQVTTVLLPWGVKPPKKAGLEILWQVRSVAQALEALAGKAKAVVLKGCEGAGACGEESTFLLFQQLVAPCREANVELYLQGGVGVHTAAAYLALGATGVIFDSQMAGMLECSAPAELKAAFGRLSGSEIRVVEGYHYYLRPGMPELGEDATLQDLLARPRDGAQPEWLPLGQDVILAADLASQYRKVTHLVRAVRQRATSHLRLACATDLLAPGTAMADLLGTTYPLAQGPMARISDVPEFSRAVADGGALPFLAMSMMRGEAAEQALVKTAEAMDGKAWGVGILGFAYPKMLEEQTRLILAAKPPVVLIAGGRPTQAKAFEQEGIKTFLHVPAAGLLDMYLKEGARSFIFEGRESGGHVGPLYSTVLWEKQLARLLAFEDVSALSVFFAGGIHDALSAAFIRIMAAPFAARDGKVGLLVGTAYLYTDEIVSSGAITAEYRQLLIEGKKTVLLKSGSGQESRAVPSAFTEFFAGEHARMRAEGMESPQILMKLEELNLGRLRIAAKGLERSGDEIVELTQEQQLERGLYMTGAITPLIDEATTIEALHERLVVQSKALLASIASAATPRESVDASIAAPADIAIVGMAGIFPDAANIDEYWRNIIFNKNSITEVPAQRWQPELFYDPDTKDTDHVVSKWGGFIDSTDFDALEFGITPQSLAAIEPVQLLSLLVTKRAFEDAGYDDLATVDLDDTSVIFGAQGAGELSGGYGSRAGLRKLFGGLSDKLDYMLPNLTEDSFPGILSNVIAGRISNRLNTGGRNYTVDAACASSLAALDIAVGELTSNRANMVALGGADLHNGIIDFLMFSSTYALSKKGRCATFDADSDGITLGEGIGVVILKRLEDAKRDGNKIYAVIKGIGGSSDGKQLGLTAPSKHGQNRALKRAYESAGVSPRDVGYVEAHGTGTAVGDRIELGALTDVFIEAGTLPQQVQVGSVKTLIGHTKCAAGIAGLIKATLCVRHGILPPTLHLNKPNDSWAHGGPFFFRTEKAGFWRGDRRIAGISGFGFGGTNFHAIVENYDAARPSATLKAWPSELCVFRGETPEEAQELMRRAVILYGLNDSLLLKDVAYSLARYNPTAPVQYAIVANDRAGLLSRIEVALSGGTVEGLYERDAVEGKVALLFPGQGSQHINMAADLFIAFPKMRGLLEANPAFETILFPPAAFSDAERKAQRAALTETTNAQPLLGIVDLAIAELLRDLGVEADMVAGHSFGELPALCYAGALVPDELVDLSRARAEAVCAAVGDDPGSMVAVRCDRETLEGLLEGQAEVWAVNYNAPKQIVVAGSTAGLAAFTAKLDEAKVAFDALNVACAFHSPLLAAAEGLFASTLKGTTVHKATLPVWSNTTAEPYPTTAQALKKRLATHLVSPVRFTEEIEAMYADGARVFIEAGPGGVLGGLTKRIVTGEDEAVRIIQTEKAGTEGLTFLLQGLANYLTTGRELTMEELFEGRDVQELDIDAPESHRKGGAVWSINGTAAVPVSGELPAHAGRIFKGPILSLDQLHGPLTGQSVEAIMMAYLDNMNAVIQDQRDVMLGYLGQPEAIERTTVRRAVAMPAVVGAPALVEDISATPAEGSKQGALPDIASLTTEQITDLILNIVSEKTGYPIDMLELDMELEADLSIDSIKKMEIIGGLRESVAFPEDEADMDAFFERMISVKTFRDLVGWIEEIGRAAAEGGSISQQEGFAGAQAVVGTGVSNAAEDSSGSADATSDAEAAADAEGEVRIVRMALAEHVAPLGETDAELVRDKLFALTDDGGGLAQAVADELASRGAKTELIGSADADLSAFDGLIVINSIAGNRTTTFDLFDLLKQADMQKLHWIASFDDVSATLLDAQDLAQIDLLEGFPGFLKTLVHEYPKKRICAATYQTAFDVSSLPAQVADELCAVKPFPEVFYRGAERYLLLPTIGDLAHDAKGAELGLSAESTIMVLGGAQGITPHLVARFAAVHPCHYLLVGRTELADEGNAYEGLATVDEIRGYLIEKEDMKQPKKVEAKARSIFKAQQIRAAIKLIEDAGATASYQSVDVCDAASFSAFIAEAVKTHGAIDGVIHAAGVLEDKLFRSMSKDAFVRVYTTKAVPLAVVAKELPDLKLLVMFSSMSSSFGNAGQCNYAAGNSVMDLAARILERKRPGLRVMAFNWGPWKGAGMVNAGLENEFRKRGIAFLELDEGGTFFVDELTKGTEPSVLAIAGKEQEIGKLIATL
jgi:acyl transferase domain-containing protein/NAD(P)H-dependent flavin oxidoreductase YrpB (nitropropane dioxygenase family)/NAD(P)-dependent dehydrogenase (short-subunit alcohol dehydrogenase family)/acyl carrier protein